MAKFEITKRKNDEFQFNLKASNGEIILTSEGYKAKASCKDGIESVKKNSADNKHFKKLEAKDGKPYFTLVAGNGEVIGTSETYSSDSARDHGIESVKKNAPIAEIDDHS